MPKVFEGVVVSLKMQKTAVVLVTRATKHPIYKKIIKKDKRIKADSSSFDVELGQKVRIGEVRPFSKEKHFKILEVLKK
jgi:small subunit ribosomal protein S17